MAKINTTISFRDEVSQNMKMMNQALTTLNSTLREMQGAAKGAGAGVDTLGGKAQGLGKLFSFNQAVSAFQAVKGAVNSVTASIGEMSDAYSFQMEQETKLETVMRNHMKASEEQIKSVKQLTSDLQGAGIYGDEMQMAGLQELATYVDDVDTLKGLAPVLNSMLAQGVGTNATARDMQSYATMLGKVMQGQVGGMSKRGYKFTEAEEEILKTGTELQKLQVLQNNVLGNFGDMNAALAQTPQGQIIQLNNTFGDLKEEIGKALIPYTQLFTISTMQWKIKWYETIIKALNFLTEHINQAIIALAALGTAAVAVGVYFAILHKQEIAAAIAAAAHWMATHAAIIATVAVIVAVIAAIAALLIFSEKTFPAIGYIIGSVVGSVASLVYNVGSELWNFIIDFAEFLANVFNDPVGSIARLFFDVFDRILGIVSSVAGAIGVLFGQDWSKGIDTFRNNMKDFENQTFGEKKVSLDNLRTQKISGLDFAYKGMEIGSNLSGKMQGWLDDKLSGVKGLLNGSSLSGADLGLKTDSTGALVTADKNVLELSDEYKELLSAQARRKFNLSFSQVVPQVNMGGVTVNNNADIDKMLSDFAREVEEAAAASLESA